MSEYDVKSLGSCKFDSPLPSIFFVNEAHGRVRVDATVSSEGKDGDRAASFEKAGPREKVFFKGDGSRIAIVTCGGLCPGMNDVIRGLVMVAWYRYGVDPKYIETLEKAGLVFSGKAPDHPIMQILEIAEHPFFMGTQAHPCLTSRPLRPSPMFVGLIAAAMQRHYPGKTCRKREILNSKS